MLFGVSRSRSLAARRVLARSSAARAREPIPAPTHILSPIPPAATPTFAATATHKLPRLYLSGLLHLAAEVELDADSAHYLTSVMRLKPGRQLRVFGPNGEFLATLLPSTRRSAVVQIERLLRRVGEPLSDVSSSSSATSSSSPSASVSLSSSSSSTSTTATAAAAPSLAPVHLYFAPIKRARLKVLLEKATELGVDVLVPVLTQNVNEKYTPGGDRGDGRSEAGAGAVASSSYQRVLIEAAEQSERMTVPVLEEPTTLSALLARFGGAQGAGVLYVCRERVAGGMTLLQALLQRRKGGVGLGGAISLLVGPEGGFTAAELREMEARCSKDPSEGAGALTGAGGASEQGGAGVVFVSLGGAVLRAETAAMAALAVVGGVQDYTTRGGLS